MSDYFYAEYRITIPDGTTEEEVVAYMNDAVARAQEELQQKILERQLIEARITSSILKAIYSQSNNF